MTKVLIRNGYDTHVNVHRPARNYGHTARLGVRRGRQFAYVHFARPVPPGATIVKATLRLTSYAMAEDIERTMTVARISERTSFSAVTWDTRPDFHPDDVVTTVKTGPLGGKHQWEIDVTAHVQKIADGADWYGWHVEITEAADRYIYSAATTQRPELEVEYADEPDAPIDLVPDGGLHVSEPSPVFRFSYVDVGGDTVLTHAQVQISGSATTTPTGEFVTPTYDTGTRKVSEPELNMALTGWSGAAAGAETFWIVRVADGAGLWSDWSDPASFVYTAPGNLTMTSPTGNVFSDPTPVVAWSLSGATQTAFAVYVYPRDLWSPRLHYSGKITSDQTSYEIPDGVILDDDAEYRFHLQVWDDVDRVATPGEPPYMTDGVVTHFDGDAAVAPVASLRVIPQDPLPFITVDWTYKEALPDGWVIFRDGKVIARVDYDDDRVHEVSSTRYMWTDRTAAPRREHRYQVRPIVTGRMAKGGPTPRVTSRPTGIWLLANNASLCLVDTDEGTWAMGEQSTTHEILGGDSVKIVTQAMRGYEGSVSGLLLSGVAGVDSTAQEARDRVMAFRSNPRQPFRLVLSDMNIPVTITDLVPVPRPEEELMYSVSFNFWQTGELAFEAL